MGKRKKYTAIFSCLVLVVALGRGVLQGSKRP